MTWSPSLPVSLPTPDVDSAAHSARVASHLLECLQHAGGALSFAEFMHEALYAPGLGYYQAGSEKFADDGDFTTAPEISPLFAATIARQCLPVLAAAAQPSIVEFGAGSGALAAGVLATLREHDCLPEHYYVVEVSADLQQRQQRLLEAHVPDLLPRVHWVSDPAGLRIDGVVFANEVLDALPVERFRIAAGGRVEQQIVVAADAGWTDDWRAAPAMLREAVQALQATLGMPMAEGYVSEICLAADDWLALCAGMLESGLVLLSDYGYGRREYYAPERNGGTLMCHFRHRAHADALVLPGIQDITAWVDFTRVAEALDRAGLDYLGYTSQSQFLMQAGLLDLLEASKDADRLAPGVKRLMMPGEMGERFRFIGFRRNMTVTPSGFAGRDYGWQL